MRTFAFLALFLPGLISFGQKKQVCFSFDDLPFVSYGITDTAFQKEQFFRLIHSLNKNDIPAIGFVNEINLYNRKGINPFEIELLNKWIDSGLEIGNHTFSHLNYFTVSFKEYSQDILKGEKLIKEILGHKGLTLKYFRYPYLQTGNSKAKADSLNRFLSDHGYTPAPVTITDEDFYFALAYRRAWGRNDANLLKQIGHDYVVYMEKRLRYFEKLANSLFGRDIKQILILHSSSLNANYIDSLADVFRRNNYEFVNMDRALEDEAYKTPVTVFGNWGISWIDRWALSKGKRGEFFRDNPPTPDYILKMSK